MKVLNFSIFSLCLVLSLFVFSCSKAKIPEDKPIIPIDNKNDTTIIDSAKGTLLIDENFQKWDRAGYVGSSYQNCLTDLMTSTNTVSYVTTEVQVIYNTITVSYILKYFAINPTCGNDAGTSTLTSNVSIGYIALQAPISYVCLGHKLSADAQIVTSVLPSVSTISFSISYSLSDVDYMRGITLWKKGMNDSLFVKVKDFSILTNPTDSYDTVVYKKINGQVFSANINEENVKLRFTCRWPNDVEFNTTDPDQLALLKNNLPSKDPIINRAVRIHDLKVWGMKEQQLKY